MNAQKGFELPVSAFEGMEDGTFVAGTAAYEKRGIAVNIPEWQKDKCIQCNQCAFVCPHATIRPFLLSEEEMANAPEGFKAVPAKALKTSEPMNYSITITPLDCTGCGNCAQVCPAPGKALIMKPVETLPEQVEAWDYAVNNVTVKANPMNKNTAIMAKNLNTIRFIYTHYNRFVSTFQVLRNSITKFFLN